MSGYPKLKFATAFDDRDAHEAEARGFLANVSVQMPSGALIPVVFWDAVRLAQGRRANARVMRSPVAP